MLPAGVANRAGLQIEVVQGRVGYQPGGPDVPAEMIGKHLVTFPEVAHVLYEPPGRFQLPDCRFGRVVVVIEQVRPLFQVVSVEHARIVVLEEQLELLGRRGRCPFLGEGFEGVDLSALYLVVNVVVDRQLAV